MAKKHQAHYGKEILVARQPRIGTQHIRRTPKPLFDCFNVFQLSQFLPLVFVERADTVSNTRPFLSSQSNPAGAVGLWAGPASGHRTSMLSHELVVWRMGWWFGVRAGVLAFEGVFSRQEGNSRDL